MGPSCSELRWLPGPVPLEKASNAVHARRLEDSGKVYPPYSVLKDFEPDLTMASSQVARTSPTVVGAAAKLSTYPSAARASLCVHCTSEVL